MRAYGRNTSQLFYTFQKDLKLAKVKGYFEKLPTENIKFSKSSRSESVKKEV